MHRRVRWLGTVALGAAALALPATAAAATTATVYAGVPPGTRQLVAKLGATSLGKYQPGINAFFNRRATIRVGDSVRFQLLGFHTVDLPAAGGSDLPFIVPSGGLVTGVNDAAGNPFWFNGHLPNLGFNPLLFKASGGKVYTGKSRIDTGAPVGPKAPKPFVVKFTKAGTYKYFCDVHPGMIGYITVKPKSAAVPSAQANAAARLAQLTTDIRGAVKAVVKTKVKANNVSIGAAGKDNVEVLAMFPQTLHVHPGTTVSFAMATRTGETHTATFGPLAYLNPLANSIGGPTPVATAVYPSSPPGTALAVPGTHGNGFANSGALDRNSHSPLPAGAKFTFTAPGTYRYQCLIHPFMVGKIVVK